MPDDCDRWLRPRAMPRGTDPSQLVTASPMDGPVRAAVIACRGTAPAMAMATLTLRARQARGCGG